MAAIPATFMTAVCTTYIIVAPEGFKLSMTIGAPVGVIAAVVALVGFLAAAKKAKTKLAA